MNKETRIKLGSEDAARVASTGHSANINAVAFNIDLIVSKNPTLALQIMELYLKARDIKPDDPQYPEEDYAAALEKLKGLL